MNNPVVAPLQSWPQPDAPCEPLRPKDRGWHWLRDSRGRLIVGEWIPASYGEPHGWLGLNPGDRPSVQAAEDFAYVGAVLTPSEELVLNGKVAEALTALRFYANEANWIDTPSWDGDASCFTPKAIPVADEEGRPCDCGDTARRAVNNILGQTMSAPPTSEVHRAIAWFSDAVRRRVLLNNMPEAAVTQAALLVVDWTKTATEALAADYEVRATALLRRLLNPGAEVLHIGQLVHDQPDPKGDALQRAYLAMVGRVLDGWRPKDGGDVSATEVSNRALSSLLSIQHATWAAQARNLVTHLHLQILRGEARLTVDAQTALRNYRDLLTANLAVARRPGED